MGANLIQLGELVTDGEHFEGGLLGHVLPKSVFTQIRHLLLCISTSKGYVDGSVVELTFSKRLEKHSVRDTPPWRQPRGKSYINFPHMLPPGGSI